MKAPASRGGALAVAAGQPHAGAVLTVIGERDAFVLLNEMGTRPQRRSSGGGIQESPKLADVQTSDWISVGGVLATLAAVGAAVATPYLAAGIEKRRRHRAAIRLAELTVQAIAMLATLRGAAGAHPVANAAEMARSINLPSLLGRMEAIPPPDVDNADALEAFVRIAALARAASESSDDVEKVGLPNVDRAVALLEEFPVLVDEAKDQLARLKASLH